MEPPIAERHLSEVIFGKVKGRDNGDSKFLMNPTIKKKDYYYWLRDDNRKNKKVLKYLEEENDYYDNVFLSGINPEKNKILSELRKSLVEDYVTVELPDGDKGFESPYRFYKKYEKNKSYPIFYYKKNDKNIKYLDPNDFKNGEFSDISNPIFSNDLSLFSYGIDKNGNEKYSINILTFPSLEPIQHDLPNILYSSYILTNAFVFYLKCTDSNRPYQLYKYDIQSRNIELIFEETNINMEIEFSLGDDNKSIVYGTGNYEQNEMYVYWFDGERKGINMKVKKMARNVLYDTYIYNDYFIIKTNEKGCKNYMLKYCKIGKNRFMDFIPYNEKVLIEYVNIIKNAILIQCRSEGEQYFKLLTIDGINIVDSKKIKKWEGGYFLNLTYCELNSEKIIYSYQDLITPTTWYELNLSNMKQTKIKETETKNYDKNNYKVERIFVKNNKIKIPVDIIQSKKSKSDKCLLYGYNSYGSNIEMRFDDDIFHLIDRGFNYAVANTRGSSYMGTQFYDDGKMLKKMNTFNDFIKVSEYLIKNNYCSKDGLSIEGRSAGGLLVGACSILRPDLYHNVLAIVPFVDVLTTMSDSSIPLTTSEWLQWGNPNIKKYYNYMKKYSPIDNIKKGICYPNYYVQAGLNDPRVAYWEPAKFVATLRYSMNNECKSVIVLKTEMNKGHFSGLDRYKYLDDVASKYAFLLRI